MTDNRPLADNPRAHDHGPLPSYEWILQGDRLTVIPHLKTLAPTLSLDGGHFDVGELDRRDQDLPALFMIQLNDVPVGGVDFLPLPSERTLMRLYLCSDLGTACELENGEELAAGFVQILLGRLLHLGFVGLYQPGVAEPRGPLGFATPAEKPPGR